MKLVADGAKTKHALALHNICESLPMAASFMRGDAALGSTRRCVVQSIPHRLPQVVHIPEGI